MKENAKMKKFRSHREYTGIYNEIVHQSSRADKLFNICMALLCDNYRLSVEVKRQRAALEQVQHLIKELYILLKSKINEVTFMKQCLAVSQFSQDGFLQNMNSLCDSVDCFSKVESIIETMLNSGKIVNIFAQVLCKNYNKTFFSKLAKCAAQALACTSEMFECFTEISSLWLSSKESESEPILDKIKTVRKRGKKPIVKNDKAKRSKMQEKNGVTMNNFPKCSNRRNKIKKEKRKGSNSVRQVKNELYFNNVKISKSDWKHLKLSLNRRLEVTLIDVLNNPAAECDDVVRRYKQANLCNVKDNVCEVLDVDGQDNNKEKPSNSSEKCDLKKSEKDVQHESNNVSFNEDEDFNSGSSTESDSEDEDDEQEPTLVISDADEDEQHEIESEKTNSEDKQTPGSSKSEYFAHGKKGPRTPTLNESIRTSPRTRVTPSPIDPIRMGPQTPPSSPESLKRGNCTVSRGPRTPPYSPPNSAPFRKGPRTPSPPEPPKCLRRGPRTPPDSSQDEDSNPEKSDSDGSETFHTVYSSDEDSAAY